MFVNLTILPDIATCSHIQGLFFSYQTWTLTHTTFVYLLCVHIYFVVGGIWDHIYFIMCELWTPFLHDKTATLDGS